MRQVLFRIPLLFTELPVYGYGVMLCLAFIICTWLAGRRAQKVGIAKERIQDLAIWLLLGGLLGARTTYLLHERPESIGEFFWRFPRIWDGGIILYGAVIGGLLGYGLAYLLVIRKYGLSTWKVADIIAPSAAIGLCLGRIGCLLNGCCWGNIAPHDCPSLHFPLSAPARSSLVEEGLQTAAGFTSNENTVPPSVNRVEPASPANANGLRDRDTIVGVNHREMKYLIRVPGEENARTYDDLQSYQRDLDDFQKKGKRVATGPLSDALARDWPRGVNELTLTVERMGQEVDLPTFEPRTLGLHPTQVYESISMALVFLLLSALYPLRRHDGEVMIALMLCYGVHRYLNEQLRNDPRPVGFEQYVSVVLVGAAIIMALWLWRRPEQYGPAAKSG